MKKIFSFIAALLIVLALGSGAYWYYSPFLAMKSMAQAAKEKNADKFNEGVDYPRLRESLKGQISAQLAMTIGKEGSNPLSGLGAMLGMAMVNQIVDTFVRPEMVMEMMKDGAVKTEKSATPSNNSADQDIKWVVERKGVDRVLATPQNMQDPSSKEPVGLVFERTGFASWKLIELRMSFTDK
jgi:hypothetical protein